VSAAAALSRNEYAQLDALVRAGSVDAVVDWLRDSGWADPRMVRAMIASAGGSLLVTPANFTDIRSYLVIEPRPAIGAGALAMKIREKAP
jgi:hypothetical protein